MAHQPLILITNDDGVQSPGLHATIEAVADLGELLIVAPGKQQTGSGRSYWPKTEPTIHTTTLPLNGSRFTAYYADVSPAVAVSVGIMEFAQRPIDLCISGINFGENVGSGVTISGTVGAAIEAGCSNIPALAVSLETPHQYHLNHSSEVDFSAAAHFTRYFAQRVLQKGLPDGVDLLKIDVPASATADTAWKMAKVSRQRYYEPIPKHLRSENGLPYGVNFNSDTLEPDSDVYVFAVDKLVAVVPMTIDLTAPVTLPDVADFLNQKP